MKGFPYEPACWSWDLPAVRTRDEEIDRLLAEQVGKPLDRQLTRGALELVMYDWPGYLLSAWHEGRCALCGCEGEHLVDDHDHWTGLRRGLLCRSCNVREGIGGSDEVAPAFPLYRERHPAVILGARSYYVGRGWEVGWWRDERRARRLTGNPEWTLDAAREQLLLP